MDIQQVSDHLALALRTKSTPIAITFLAQNNRLATAAASPMPEPVDGRTGALPAGCVYWVQAGTQEIVTVKADHANCSVGSFTHGFLPLADAAEQSDVAQLLDAGWISEASFAGIEHVRQEPGAIVYGPLGSATAEPDVVLVIAPAIGAMIFADAFPGIRIESKPQCHIVAIAKEQKVPAISLGCMLSRTRTGMASSDLTIAFPGGMLGEVMDKLGRTAEADKAVAAYAAQDAQRFSRPKAARPERR